VIVTTGPPPSPGSGVTAPGVGASVGASVGAATVLIESSEARSVFVGVPEESAKVGIPSGVHSSLKPI
jgi:hypothetical protein